MIQLCDSQPYIYTQQDDDSFILYESRAIARYIARKYASQGTPLIPTELKAEALFEQATSIETSYFEYASSAVSEGVFKKYAVIQSFRLLGWFSKQNNNLFKVPWLGTRSGCTRRTPSKVARKDGRVRSNPEQAKVPWW